MAYLIDPPNMAGSPGGGVIQTPGKKVLAFVGMERRVSQNGNNMINCRFVCVDDLENGGKDVGSGLFESFVFTDKAAWKLANYAMAVGHETKFDAERDEELLAVLKAGVVVADVSMEERTDRDGNLRQNPRVNNWAGHEGEWDGDWKDIIKSAQAWYQDFRAKQGGGGASKKRSRTEDPMSADDRPPTPDDDISY